MAKLTFNTGSGNTVPGQLDAQARAPQRDVASVPGQQPMQAGRSGKLGGKTDAKDGKANQQVNSVFGSVDQSGDYGPDYGYRRIRFHKGDEVNPYADAQDARYGMDARMSKLIVVAVALVAVFFLVCILPTNVLDPLARHDRTIGTLAAETAASFGALIDFFRNPNTMFGTHVFTVLVTLLAGAAMGLSGGVFQGAMKNALASPSTLGVTNGGTIGAVIFAVFIAPNTVGATFQGQISDYSDRVANMDVAQYIMELYGSFLASLVGCIVVVFLVMSIALIAGRGKVSNASLVIAGQVFAAAITVVIQFIRDYLVLHGDQAAVQVLTAAQSSTFSGSYDVISVAIFAIPLIICMAVIILMSGRLTLLAFNDEEARSMGISTARTRNVMVALCTIMTALVVSFCGAVGFVGFLVPHIARKMVGPDFRYLLPASALLGAVMVCVVFYISELGIPWIASGSTGVVTSIVGCVAFIVMALKNRGSASGEWL